MLTYPANQKWGTLFIIFGSLGPPGQRTSIDLSAYNSLVVDLRGIVSGQCVNLGITDSTQRDDGSDITKPKCMTTKWATIMLLLSTFTKVNLAHIYVVFEMDFQGQSSTTVELRNIRYSPR